MLVEEIVKQLSDWSKAYYEGHQVVTDQKYDRLEEQLRSLDPGNPYFKKNRESDAVLYGVKRKHLYGFVGSVGKIHDLSESRIINRGDAVTISAKLDGTSMTVYFKNGKLLYALTRGDGIFGFDITDKYLAITRKYQISIPTGFTGGIRGEVVMPNSSWAKYKKIHPEASMQRNTGTGLINRKGADPELSYLDFLVYEIMATSETEEAGSLSEFQQLERLNFGYPIAPWLQLSRVTLGDLNLLRDVASTEWPLDGVVLKKALPPIIEGDLAMPLSEKEAYKFEAESKETFIEDVEWTLQGSGRLVPVAVLNPVELSGAVVKRVTLNNYKYMASLGAVPGSKVEVCRANEVIPHINSLVARGPYYDYPTFCPHCGKRLEIEGVHLVCTNPECPELNRLAILNMLRAYGKDIKGIAESLYSLVEKDTIEQTLNYLLSGLWDNQLSEHQLKLISLLRDEVLNTTTWVKIIEASAIEGVGEKSLSKLENDLDWVRDYVVDKPLSRGPQGIGQALTKELLSKDNRELVYRIFRALTDNQVIIKDPQVQESTGQTRYYCITGGLEGYTRKEFEAYCKSKGWEMASIKKAECLVTNDPNSGSSKNQEAQKLGKQIFTQAEFENKFLK